MDENNFTYPEKFDLNKEKFLFERINDGPINILCCFPNTYQVGMASLGYQHVFKLFSMSELSSTYRFFTNFNEKYPKDIHLISFSISWELDFHNVFEILERLQIPLRGADRDSSHPLIYAGGPVITANPEPWSDFFDFVAIGDCEENISSIVETSYKYWNTENIDRTNLSYFTEVPGIYVPSLYPVIEALSSEDSSNKLPDESLTNLPAVKPQKSSANNLAMSTVIAPDSCWGDVALIEVVRSCPEMCRFCLASYLTLPFRKPDLESDLIKKVNFALEFTNNLGLLGASVTQHPEFMNLLHYLIEHPNKPSFQIASVRASTVTLEMTELLFKAGIKTLTIAIESGSERLRDIINKKLPEKYIFEAAKNAEQAGLKILKLYGMVGLPFETEQDIEDTITLLTNLKKEHKKLKIVWGCSIFTPKAQTPYQDYGIDTSSEAKLKKLIKALKPKGIEVRPESYKWAQVQALLSRGDRTLGKYLEEIYNLKQQGFGIFKKVLPKDLYKHIVFNEWHTEMYPWQHIMQDKQKEMLKNHKLQAKSLAELN